MKKIRVGIVNYLNTKPLLYGIERSAVMDMAELVPDYPSNIARMLLEGSIDLGLVPVAVIPQMKEFHIVSDYCIGCDGPVASVAIFSDMPLEQVETLMLDYQSRTSVALAKILLKEYWKLSPLLVDAGNEFADEIRGTRAGLLIGDRALQQRSKSAYIYDLGEAWKHYTGLPFVFAAWLSNKKLDPAFIDAFNKANAYGLQRIPEIVEQYPFPFFDLTAYYNRHISYELNTDKKTALEIFLQKLVDL